MIAVAAAPLVACVDTDPGVSELVCEVLRDQGLRTVPVVTGDTAGLAATLATLRSLQPEVVVASVGMPYTLSWASIQLLQQALDQTRWVVTTTNPEAVRELVGPASTLPILGMPFDLDELVSAVLRVAQGPAFS